MSVGRLDHFSKTTGVKIMDIDTERLKTDPDYWDEFAPEGATHYCPILTYFTTEDDTCSPCSQCFPRPTTPNSADRRIDFRRLGLSVSGWLRLSVSGWFAGNGRSALMDMLCRRPSQSLAHIKADRERAIEVGLNSLDLTGCRITSFEDDVISIVTQLVDAGWKPPQEPIK